MHKGIAIQTLLLVLLGIVVVGILIYLLYYYASSKQLSVHECRARLTEICIQCKNLDFDSHGISTTLTLDCSEYGEFSEWNGIDNCEPAPPDGDKVKNLCRNIGIT